MKNRCKNHFEDSFFLTDADYKKTGENTAVTEPGNKIIISRKLNRK